MLKLSDAWWPLLLATAAGLSTSIGAVVAVIRKPSARAMAALLGLALGVMATVSGVELLARNAAEAAQRRAEGGAGDPVLVLVAAAAGALTYYLLEPFFPKMDESHDHIKKQDDVDDHEAFFRSLHSAASQQGQGQGPHSATGDVERAGPGHGAGRRTHAGRMLRLGLLMALTMTLHNLPEGFAVAFSAFTDFGPVMALAIALHNIPEGIIVAAPIYAATGSRLRAIGVATASGLSEPAGALLSLLLLQPFFTPERLQYMLAFVGGIMLAVCAIELWPEGRNCRNDRAFAAGIVGGSLVMGWTLYVEG
ncbi:hypothetical protein GPECTOR_5g314 [Gonium pectorale]|uniref:ZIP protein n=1 Tax=Gonium pectorale TaxID=33097 RepID=A0A150GX09_GONPE|nr:hypothetical protein GPECTOR_5g314 [Gonium pectorale]|eukprot:KXZ54222.1 hypothetical protein GPECTOR_5g314 [Gonium pectorale]